MTTEEKAKAYDEALERASHIKDNNTVATPQEVAEHIFPELRESEDEQTRRRLIDFISNIKAISESGRNSWAIRKEDAEMCNAFLLYLEKQKEQKSIGTDFRTAVKNLMNLHKIKNKFTEEDYDFHTKELLELVEQKPAEWSEEDEDIRDTIIHDLKRLGGDIANVMPAYKKEIDWLKSIRPQPHWKPSEEQIATLEQWLKNKQLDGNSRYAYPIFESLYNDLKKLM